MWPRVLTKLFCTRLKVKSDKGVRRLSKNDVKVIINRGQAFVGHFNAVSYQSFVDVWETRLAEAIEVHKDRILEKQACAIISFAKERRVDNLHLCLYPKATDGIPEVGFLYDSLTGDFLQTGPEYFTD